MMKRGVAFKKACMKKMRYQRWKPKMAATFDITSAYQGGRTGPRALQSA